MDKYPGYKNGGLVGLELYDPLEWLPGELERLGLSQAQSAERKTCSPWGNTIDKSFDTSGKFTKDTILENCSVLPPQENLWKLEEVYFRILNGLEEKSPKIQENGETEFDKAIKNHPEVSQEERHCCQDLMHLGTDVNLNSIFSPESQTPKQDFTVPGTEEVEEHDVQDGFDKVSECTHMPWKQEVKGSDQNFPDDIEGTARASRKICNRICGFCRTNGEMTKNFTNHTLRDDNGKLVCPILRSYNCPKCGATGDDAHTSSYCPRGSVIRYTLPLSLKLKTTKRNATSLRRSQY